MTMSKDERDLLLLLARVYVTPANEFESPIVVRAVTALADAIKKDALEIKPGDTVAIKRKVVRIENGTVVFLSDDGKEAYGRTGDIVR